MVCKQRSKRDLISYHLNFKLIKKKQITVNPRILSGEAGETLKDFAEANKVDLVIVGSRGLGFFKR